LQHPAGAGSSKNHETPFREEMGFEALRTDRVVLFLPISLKNRCGIFGSGTPERKFRNMYSLFFSGLVEISED
jgi:hypothetical protein